MHAPLECQIPNVHHWLSWSFALGVRARLWWVLWSCALAFLSPKATDKQIKFSLCIQKYKLIYPNLYILGKKEYQSKQKKHGMISWCLFWHANVGAQTVGSMVGPDEGSVPTADFLMPHGLPTSSRLAQLIDGYQVNRQVVTGAGFYLAVQWSSSKRWNREKAGI